MFYPLKDSRSLLYSKFPPESLNPSRSFLKCFIVFTSYPYFLSYIFVFVFVFCFFYLFQGILEFWCLATVTFKFTVFYNNIYRKKKNNMCNPAIFKTLAYPESKAYSTSCQASIMKYFIQNLV